MTASHDPELRVFRDLDFSPLQATTGSEPSIHRYDKSMPLPVSLGLNILAVASG